MSACVVCLSMQMMHRETILKDLRVDQVENETFYKLTQKIVRLRKLVSAAAPLIGTHSLSDTLRRSQFALFRSICTSSPLSASHHRRDSVTHTEAIIHSLFSSLIKHQPCYTLSASSATLAKSASSIEAHSPSLQCKYHIMALLIHTKRRRLDLLSPSVKGSLRTLPPDSSLFSANLSLL